MGAVGPTSFPGIKFFRQNENNDALAALPTGGSSGQATDEILRPDSLSYSGTVAITNGSPTVTGTGTTFLTQVQQNQLFFIFSGSDPVMIGKVQSVNSNTSITLASNVVAATASSLAYGATNRLLRTGESWWARVPVITSGGQYTVPSPRNLRSKNGSPSGDPAYPSNTSVLALIQYSNVGTPDVVGTPVNIPVTLDRKNPVPTTSTPGNGNINFSSPPLFWWILINPAVSSTPSLDFLPSATTFEIFMESLLEGYQFQNGDPAYISVAVDQYGNI